MIQSAIIASGDETVGNPLAWFRQVVANPDGGMHTKRLADAARSLGLQIDGTPIPRRNYKERSERIAHMREQGIRHLAWVLMSGGVSEEKFIEGIKRDLLTISSQGVLRNIYLMTSSHGDHPYVEDCDPDEPIRDRSVTLPLPDWGMIFKAGLSDRAFGVTSPPAAPEPASEFVTKAEAEW